MLNHASGATTRYYTLRAVTQPLTDNPLRSVQIRPDSHVLKFDLHQRRLAQFVDRKLSQALHFGEEQHLR